MLYLVSANYVPGTILHVETHLVLGQPDEVGIIITNPILQMKKPWHREAE